MVLRYIGRETALRAEMVWTWTEKGKWTKDDEDIAARQEKNRMTTEKI